MRKTIGTFFIVIYAIIAMAVTILLLSYNEYLCSEIGGYTFYIVPDENLEPNYEKGDLLIIKQVKSNKVEIGDRIFLYRNISKSEFEVYNGEVTDKIEYANHFIYTLDNQYQFDSTYLIGVEDGSMAFHNLGTILAILESRWGYLFCIVIVTLLIFLEECYELFIEIKYGNETSEQRG